MSQPMSLFDELGLVSGLGAAQLWSGVPPEVTSTLLHDGPGRASWWRHRRCLPSWVPNMLRH